jgi:hypothetical protein
VSVLADGHEASIPVAERQEGAGQREEEEARTGPVQTVQVQAGQV